MHGVCANGISLFPGSHHLFASASTPQSSHYETRSDGFPRPQRVLRSSFQLKLFVGILTAKPPQYAARSHSRLSSTPTDVRSSPYYFPRIFHPIQGTALVPHFPIITNRALVQREIAKAMRNVAIEPPGTRVRCVAISSTDPNGAGTHRFTVFFEITKPFG